MARKVCPACKKLNGGSAVTCSRCGVAFDSSTVVSASRPTMRRCPGCKTQSNPLLYTCGCGHVFEDVQEFRDQLEDRVRVGWSYFVLGMLGFVACVALTILTSGAFAILWIGGGFLAARGLMIRRAAKLSLNEMRKVNDGLPSVRVVS